MTAAARPPAGRERVFTGIQPSGASHLGNYLGAQRNYVALQDEYEAIYAIVDYHALTTVHDGTELRRLTREMVLDLSKVTFATGAPPVQASVAGGRLLVVLPDEVAAEVRGRVGVGSLDLLGHRDVGSQVDSTITEPAVKPPKQGAAPAVRLDLRAGYGVVEVRRISDPRGFHDVGPFDEQLTPPAAPEPTETS